MVAIRYVKVWTIEARREAWRASVEACRFCRYWRTHPYAFPGAVCRGHAKAEAAITRDEKGAPPPTPGYEVCPEHGCKIAADGECPGCDSPLTEEDRGVFDADVGDCLPHLGVGALYPETQLEGEDAWAPAPDWIGDHG